MARSLLFVAFASIASMGAANPTLSGGFADDNEELEYE